MAIIERKYRIDVIHVGKFNILDNIGILNLLESIACIHSDIAGYGIDQINETKFSWILLQWKVRIFKRVSYANEVTVKTWSRVLNHFSTLRDFEIFDEEGNLLCIASSKWVLVNIEKGISKIEDKIINRFNPEEKSVFNEKDIEKLKLPKISTPPTFTFTVKRRDIDINKHMHNTYYLQYAMEALPQDIYDNFDVKDFEIMYKTGAKLGDQVKCYYACENDSHFIVMKSNNNTKLHAVIKLS